MISVIIPTLNEAQNIEACLERLGEHPQPIEVIVADGGYRDHTLSLVNQYPRVIPVLSRRGRRRQMNAGADKASGDILLFLHADTY
jgi:glycosyltransferase involved in cell wall biosynthesis